MSICDFEESASYKISKHLYNAQKEFIVLGLCGKVGSGVSEVAEILEQPFEKLHLPQPGFQDHDSYDAHEYRILYAYAKRNWNEIYKIRTSSLITRHILTESEDRMCKFLAWITSNNEDQEDDGNEKYLEHVNSFFNCEMSFSIEEYYGKYDVSPILWTKILQPWTMKMKHPEAFAHNRYAVLRFRTGGKSQPPP